MLDKAKCSVFNIIFLFILGIYILSQLYDIDNRVKVNLSKVPHAKTIQNKNISLNQ